MHELKLLQQDPWLGPYKEAIQKRYLKTRKKAEALAGLNKPLKDFANGHLYYGMHRTPDGWVFREWAPNAKEIFLLGGFNNWQPVEEYRLQRAGKGNWEIKLPPLALQHEDLYKLLVRWEGGEGERIPAWARRVVQDHWLGIFNAQVWAPKQPYEWKHEAPGFDDPALIYEAHVGMATAGERVGTYGEFRQHILPRVVEAGYNTLQLMAIQEHPYYGSFGYHVANFFAPSSRFGTPGELKHLVDDAHGAGLKVIMDIVHSHSVKNEVEGLGRFDGTSYQYFHQGPRREHLAWDSLCFDYGKNEVLHFLLSNCKYWLEEFRFDGYRFDGVTSMLYHDHGLSRDFTSYDDYYNGQQDEDAITYLALSNQVIHEIKPQALTVAEEMSGMPGLATPVEDGGYGFDYRMAMGVPDYWIKIIKELPDEAWNVEQMYHELTRKRQEEKTVNYAESHDQALVGDKTIIFRLIDKEMYYHMAKFDPDLTVERGIALHKMIRLLTIATAGGGYLNFMGNEFGHPEWIDFPREGNGWSHKYARRQWHLVDDENLKYMFLNLFDRHMIHFVKENGILKQDWTRLFHAHAGDQVLAFERKDFLFVFNFNPTRSFTDYGINVPAGKYYIVLDSDDKMYGGHDRVDTGITYFAEKQGKISDLSPFWLKIYIPNRTVLIFKKQVPKPVY